jgi:hypothetical protein
MFKQTPLSYFHQPLSCSVDETNAKQVYDVTNVKSNIENEQYVFSLKKSPKYEIAARALILLRHRIREYNINKNGYVHINLVAKLCATNKETLIQNIHEYNMLENYDFFTIKDNYVRANTGHSIKKVDESLILPKWYGSPLFGYLNIKYNSEFHPEYMEGQDLYPIVSRNCTILHTYYIQPTKEFKVLKIDLVYLKKKEKFMYIMILFTYEIKYQLSI